MHRHALAQTRSTAACLPQLPHTTSDGRGGEKTPLPPVSQPSLLPAGGSVETDQTNSITSSRLLGSSVSLPPLTSSASLLPIPFPRSLIMQNAAVPACSGNYRPARLQLLSVVLKVPTFRPPCLSPRPEPSRWRAHALNSISWP